MYLDFYGFTEIPFSVTPNPRFIFYSKTHKEAFALLLYGIDNRFGFIELTGEVGTGKTTVLRTLLSQLNEEAYRTALIFNPSPTAVDIMRAINHEFGIPCESDNCAELLGTLNRFLLAENAAGRKVVLIIDEAQNLAPHVLEQVRLISNLETDTEKLIQIILAGQPELGRLLEREELRQINQRIALRYALTPLGREDVRAYIEHRLAMAGGRGKVAFTPSACRWLYRYTRGTPRLINILCDRALLIGYTEDRREVTGRTITLAFRDVMLKPTAGASPRFRWAAALLLVVLVLGTAGWFWLSPVKNSTATKPPPSPPPRSEARNEVPRLANRTAAVTTPPAATPEFIAAARNDIAGRSEHKNAMLAFNALASIWNSPPAEKLDRDLPPLKELRRHAKRGHLELTPFRGNLEELLRIDAPALLDLSPKGTKGTLLVALTGERDGKVMITPPLLGRSSFTRGEIASLWSGHAYIPWRNGAGIDYPVSPEHGAGSVKKLQYLLLAAGFSAVKATGSYDTVTAQTVKEFQMSRKIRETGVAGPLTLIQLYKSVDGGSFPRLSGQGKGGGA